MNDDDRVESLCSWCSERDKCDKRHNCVDAMSPLRLVQELEDGCEEDGTCIGYHQACAAALTAWIMKAADRILSNDR